MDSASKIRPSIWDQYLKQSKLTSTKSDTTSFTAPPIFNTLYDLIEKQHVGFNVGTGGFFEIQGPRGRTLSPSYRQEKDIMGKDMYKAQPPGFSIKYSKELK